MTPREVTAYHAGIDAARHAALIAGVTGPELTESEWAAHHVTEH